VAVLLIAAPVRALDYSAIVINEVDYDQPGSPDTAQFIELKNTTDRTINLKGYSFILVDAANLPGEDYLTIGFETDNFVSAGDLFVVCRSVDITTLSSEVCDKNFPNKSVVIRNSVRAGIKLLNGTEIVDSMSWGGYVEGLTEGTAPAPKDFDTKENYSLSRVPDGLDTGANDFDFKWTCSSPGRANYTTEECMCINATC